MTEQTNTTLVLKLEITILQHKQIGILDRLEELRLGILIGRFSKDKLADLAQRLRQKRQQSTDPKLNEIIHEIELRAEVEIAKYSRRPKRGSL